MMKINTLSNVNRTPMISSNNRKNVKNEDRTKDLFQASNEVSFKGASEILVDSFSKFVPVATITMVPLVFLSAYMYKQRHKLDKPIMKGTPIDEIKVDTITNSDGLPYYMVNNNENLLIFSDAKNFPEERYSPLPLEKEDLITFYKAYSILEEVSPDVKKYYKELNCVENDRNNKLLLLNLYPKRLFKKQEKPAKPKGWSYSVAGEIHNKSVSWYRSILLNPDLHITGISSFLDMINVPEINSTNHRYIE